MSENKGKEKPYYPVIAFRVPVEMREQLKEIRIKKNWTSDGEFFRSVMRQVIRQYKDQQE